MSQSILIYGGNKQSREEELFKNINKKNSPDIYIVENEKDKKSIGIEQVREAIKFSQEKPFELKTKYILIPKGELLTKEAQNSLLKILEEPPEYCEIRIGTPTEQSLLETVISRCKRIQIKVAKETIEDKSYSYKTFYKSSTGEKLDIVEELSKEEKEYILEILESWIKEERNNIVNGTNNINTLIKVYEDLKVTNINTKLALEHLAISY